MALSGFPSRPFDRCDMCRQPAKNQLMQSVVVTHPSLPERRHVYCFQCISLLNATVAVLVAKGEIVIQRRWRK